jgi:tape measure domain-containing protein
MTGFIYTIGLNVTGQGSVTSAVAATNNLDNSVNRVGRDVKTMGNNSQMAGRQATNSFNEAGSALKSWIVGLGIGIATLGSLQTAAQAEGVTKFIEFASAGEGAKNIQFLDQTIDGLGLNITATREAYKSWLGGIQGTNISMQQQRDIFYGVAEAASVMRLTGEQTQGTFIALSQMASKGKVSAEELRGQLGERLPGAMGIAARAMGMTTAELGKQMELGNVYSEEFLPKFAAELHKTFGGAVAEAAGSATANFNRFGNSVYELKKRFGEELLPTVTSFLQSYLIPAVSWIAQHADGLLFLGSVIGGVWAAVKIWTAYQWLLNVALVANPIGLVIMAIGALVGAFVYAWNTSEKFRGFMTALWESIKEFGRIIYDFAIAPLMAMGKTLIGVFTFDKDMIAAGMSDAVKATDTIMQGVGMRMKSALEKGYADGISSDVVNPMDKFKAPDAVSAAFSNSAGGKGAGGAGGKGAGGDKIGKGIEGIGNGSAKNITIHLGKLVENITIQTTNGKEGVGQMGDMVRRELLQVLNSANLAQ